MLVPALVALISAAAPGAGPDALAPGVYVYEGGHGTIEVSRNGASGGLRFDVSTWGANGHTCTLDGELRPGEAAATLREEADGPDETCTVTFAPRPDGVGVSASEPCRRYCGMRAGFEGTYRRPPPICEPANVQAFRKEFKRLYDAKAHADAKSTLEPLLACEPFLDELELGWIRNDLAVTRHKLGDDPGCRALLAPHASLAATSDAQLREQLPPADAEAYGSLARATRYNLKLCGAKATPPRPSR